MSGKPSSPYRRFMSFVDRSAGVDGCWIWQGAHNAAGYGMFSSEGHMVRAHRWILGWERGEPLHWDEDRREEACHHCDNPPCVNPAHLYVGSRSSNMADAWRRGRFRREPYENANAQKSTCPRGHEYSGYNLMIHMGGRRRCRECKNAAERQAYARRKARVA